MYLLLWRCGSQCSNLFWRINYIQVERSMFIWQITCIFFYFRQLRIFPIHLLICKTLNSVCRFVGWCTLMHFLPANMRRETACFSSLRQRVYWHTWAVHIWLQSLWVCSCVLFSVLLIKPRCCIVIKLVLLNSDVLKWFLSDWHHKYFLSMQH